MLAEHPAALCLFEFFNGLDASRRFAPDPMTGSAFAELIGAEQPFVTAVLRRGYEVAEITYPFGEGGRFARDEPLPWILVSTLPRLSDDPDRLYDEVVAFARAQPDQPAPSHHRALFEWLCSRFDRELWIERSGSSIDYLAGLEAAFPDSRFLHIHRDGREAALSMREHHAYRLPISLLYGAPADDGVPIAEMGPLDLHEAPSGDDPISRVLASRPAADYFGRYWNDQIQRGDEARRELPAGRYAEVRFEDLVASPREELARIADFFELDPDRDAWRDRAAALVKDAASTRFETLGAAEQQVLEQACRPGLERLGRL